MSINEPDCSARGVLAELRRLYPESPFLALGQTVFWDEPVKAVLRLLLNEFELGGKMVLGVHDTDYFAKAHVRKAGVGRFALLPHNDGTTRDLWSAAGEISTLFGSETVPSRHQYVRHGVPFERLAQSADRERQEFRDEVTEAWGWRGLVYTGSRDLIVHQLPLSEVGDGILELLTWGFERAVSQIASGCCQEEACRVAERMQSWCRDYRTAHPDRNLTDLFQDVLPRLYADLLGAPPNDVTVDCTANLLLLNPATASLPRFRFVDLFLNPSSREYAIQAYNEAVAGTEMYTLDKFGSGALPFDVIVPGSGRGTLRITPRVVIIETRQPIAIALKRPLESVGDLAEVLTARLGNVVTLVGKAVTLVSMLAQEFIFVFNEEGSLYVRRTRQMNDALVRKGASLDMRPILRLRYHTWDALTVGRATLRPTAHLAATFGQPQITAEEFGRSWRQVVSEQEALCETIAALKKPLDLMRFLGVRNPVAPWEAKREEYLAARRLLTERRKEITGLVARRDGLYHRLKLLKMRAAAVQQARGDHFRSVREWTPEARQQREATERELQQIEQEKRGICAEIDTLRRERRQMEQVAEVQAARDVLRAIEDEAELARLQMVRNALLTIEGLKHTNHRPSAWWLPMVDSSGGWFRRIAETTDLYTEPLLS